MLNVSNSKFISVFQPEIKLHISERVVFANLSSSKKNTDKEGNISYQNMSWNGRFVGNSVELAKTLKNGDKIDIVSGGIINRFDKEKKKLYIDVVIFDFVFSETNKTAKEDELPEPPPAEYEDIPTDADFAQFS